MAADRSTMVSTAPTLDQALAGLDALDEVGRPSRDRLSRRAWSATWPKLVALGLILLVWQAAIWAHWKPYILQSPAAVARQLWELLGTSKWSLRTTEESAEGSAGRSRPSRAASS